MRKRKKPYGNGQAVHKKRVSTFHKSLQAEVLLPTWISKWLQTRCVANCTVAMSGLEYKPKRDSVTKIAGACIKPLLRFFFTNHESLPACALAPHPRKSRADVRELRENAESFAQVVE